MKFKLAIFSFILFLISAHAYPAEELITNGTMEADSGWSDYNTPTTNERSSEQANSGTYSRKFITDEYNDGIVSNTFTSVTGTTYRITFSVYPDTSQTAGFRWQNGTGPGNSDGWSYYNLTQDAWNDIEIYQTEDAGGEQAHVRFYSVLETPSGTWYIDDVSVQAISPAQSVGIRGYGTTRGASP